MRFLRVLPPALVLLVSACGSPGAPAPMTVASAPDSQSVLLANVYAAGLRYYGTDARVEGFADAIAALDAGKASATAGFTGRLLQRFAPGSSARSAASVYRAMVGALPEGIAAGDYATAAEDKPALAVTAATADRWGGRDLSHLVDNCAGLRVGALTGSQNAAAVGDCPLPPASEYGTPAMLFDALRSGSVEAVWTSTAATAVPSGTVVLVDRKPALIPAQNVVALYRRNELDPMQLRAVNEIAGVLDTAALVDMQRRLATGADPQALAEEWLTANPLGR